MKTLTKSVQQKSAEAAVEAFRDDLGPFVVAAEKTRMPMIFTDARAPGHPIIFANASFLALLGREREEVMGEELKTLLAGDAAVGSLVDTAFDEGDSTECEVHYKRRDGTAFWASMFVSPVCDAGGVVVQHFASFADLTRHKEDSARCRLMIDELNHRVKNTLATVQSIVGQILSRPADPAVMQEAIEARILALSRSHDLLSSSSWQGARLHDLVQIALEPFEVIAGRAERFTIRGDNVELPPQATLALAIALHELATNAVKYGAFSNDAGRITIDWKTRPHGRLLIRWIEEDGPPVTPPAHRGFGSWVIERGLSHELSGRVSLDFLPGGVACTIDMPAPQKVGS